MGTDRNVAIAVDRLLVRTLSLMEANIDSDFSTFSVSSIETRSIIDSRIHTNNPEKQVANSCRQNQNERSGSRNVIPYLPFAADVVEQPEREKPLDDHVPPRTALVAET